MRRKPRRSRFGAVLAFAGLIAIISPFIADRLTREPPNYSRIEDRLWLGGYVTQPPSGTQAVLNLCETEDTYRVESHRWRPIPDAKPVPDLGWLRERVDFLDSEIAADRVVFVHCRNGVSRSAMVVAAYLMRRERWSRDRALEFIRSSRPGVRPNPAFMELLLEWEHSLHVRSVFHSLLEVRKSTFG